MIKTVKYGIFMNEAEGRSEKKIALNRPGSKKYYLPRLGILKSRFNETLREHSSTVKNKAQVTRDQAFNLTYRRLLGSSSLYWQHQALGFYVAEILGDQSLLPTPIGPCAQPKL